MAKLAGWEACAVNSTVVQEQALRAHAWGAVLIGKKLCKNEVCGMTSVISLPVGDEVKVTQKGDDGHLSAIINSTLYRAHG